MPQQKKNAPSFIHSKRQEQDVKVSKAFGIDFNNLAIKSRHIKRPRVGSLRPESQYTIGRLVLKPRIGEPNTYDVMMKTTGMTLEQAKALHDFIEGGLPQQ